MTNEWQTVCLCNQRKHLNQYMLRTSTSSTIDCCDQENIQTQIDLWLQWRAAHCDLIVPIVNNNFKVECILDPGCQIIVISEEVCHELSLAYDPSIRLNMQLANGLINQSLGLVKNIPFKIAGINIYMQVHVLQKPAYDVLFGRPFNVLTESIVRNYRWRPDHHPTQLKYQTSHNHPNDPSRTP